MDKNLNTVYRQTLERTKTALEKNNMEAHIVETAAEVVPLLKELLTPGCTVSNGGSMSLEECGAMALLRSGSYTFLDRAAEGVDQQKLYREVFFADAYLASANAITEKGEIYEVDGNANRVAAIAFGPASVILVAGRNKIVPDLEAAYTRVRTVASPANTKRLSLKTPCAITGKCSDCSSPSRICCTDLTLRQQRIAGRIKVILVNEELGY